MKKIIRLTERDLTRIVKRVIKETMENEMTQSPEGTNGGTVKALAKRDMSSTDKRNWKGLYDLTQNDNTNFEITTTKGTPSVGGVSKNLGGKYLKPTDYIKVPKNGDEVSFKTTTGFNYEAYVYNENGVVKFGFAEE